MTKKLKIAQISDIHWRGFQRHSEYEQVFEKLYKQLVDQNVDAIVCTGDIFHTKTQNITTEVVDKLGKMFSTLGKIAPLHMILGNHDGNLANEDRQDAISPIVNAINGFKENIFLYKESGSYPLHTKNSNEVVATLHAFSLFDKEGWTKVNDLKKEGHWDIALFHGSVNGCQTDGDFTLTECDLSLNFFENYDLALLGDIHKMQFLGYKRTFDGKSKPWIGYPGSLIQQDFGERETKGWFLWEIDTSLKDWDVSFHKVENENCFLTFDWQGSVDKTLKLILSSRPTVKGTRIRIKTKETITRPELLQIQKLLKSSGAIEVVAQQDKTQNIGTIETDTVSISKQSLRNDKNSLYKLYREYLGINKEKFPLSEEQIKSGEKLIETYVDELKTNQAEETPRDISWTIKGLEFNNLYRYGENNKINFQNLSGIVGIFGPNRTGKSSIVGSLMYCLYNTTDRESVKSAHIINKKKKEGSARALINANGVDYVVTRKTTKSNTKKKTVETEDKAATTLELERLTLSNGDIEVTSENDVKRSDTDKVLRRLIGTSEDFLTTAFASQGGITNFIEAGATNRKEMLNRFLDLDIFKKLFDRANEEYKKLEMKTSGFDLATIETTKWKLENELQNLNSDLAEINEELERLRAETEQTKIWLHENKSFDQNILIFNYNSLLATKEKLSNTKTLTEQKIVSAKKAIEFNLNEIANLTNLLGTKNPETLQNSYEKLKEAKAKYLAFKANVDGNKSKLEAGRKSVKKLSLVPCGDSFPDCLYIKDSHADKANIVQLEASVLELEEKLLAMENAIKTIEEKRYEEQLKEYQQNSASLKLRQNSLDLNEKLLSELVISLTQTQVNLDKTVEELNSLAPKVNKQEQNKFNEHVELQKDLEKNIIKYEKLKSDKTIALGVTKEKIQNLIDFKETAGELVKQLKIHDSVKDAFSKNGLPALVLKTQLPAINFELDKILGGVVDFKITLETEVSSVNTLDIYIEDAHSKRLIELASGMERIIASFALRIALISLSSLPKPDFFICDEGFIFLDADGLEKCLQFLKTVKNRFKAIILITHIPEIKEIADKIIEIKNVDGESFVQA